ncbi:MAG TPA: TlpA disulfide reductase family protein [Gillisia sp.]|nr:TlpA disulfide reductase family protein [Gillisia sp.]
MKKKTKKNLIEYGLIIVIFGGLYVTGLHTEVFGFLQRGILATGIMNPDLEKGADLAVNETYPEADFSMNLINSRGERVAMEELRGKVIFLNIWATWCPPCVAEMPGINKLYKDVNKDKVAFIMLSVDQDFQKAIDFNTRKGYDFEIYELAGGLPQVYQSQSIPTTYVIDANGKLVLTHMGMGDYNTKKFKEFLEEQY